MAMSQPTHPPTQRQIDVVFSSMNMDGAFKSSWNDAQILPKLFHHSSQM